MSSELGKWPRLLVVGEDVTPEQAQVILVRTMYKWELTGDGDDSFSQWQRFCFNMPPRPQIPYDLPQEERVKQLTAQWKIEDEIADQHGLIDLYYMHNDRVRSSWVGGAHGWCDWDGSIGCNTHNVGKWPKQAEMFEDCRELAKAFPFLDMKVQLIGEPFDSATETYSFQTEGPLWHIDHGHVRWVSASAPRIDEPHEYDEGMTEEELTAHYTNPRYGIGVKKRVLREAAARARQEKQ